MLLRILAVAAMPAMSMAAIAAPSVVPRDSVYQSTVQLTNAQSHRFAWSAKRGKPQIVSMFYTSCRFVCPMLIDGTKAIDARLTTEERARVGVTLISLDPARDTPDVLARMGRERGLDMTRWTLARPELKDVRSIAGLLGIRYRALADGEFNHTTALVLLDADGRVVARTERVGGTPDEAFVAAVRKAVAVVPAAGVDSSIVISRLAYAHIGEPLTVAPVRRSHNLPP